MALSRWITNLESEARMAEEVTRAESAVKSADNSQAKRQAEASLYIARYRQADVLKTMRQIELETQGRYSIGEPMATEFKTQEAIASEGIIGIYQQGAGDGA